jgi:superoxide oxidase
LLIAKSDPLRRQLQEIHETLANVGYAFIGVHAAAALFHHYVRRDNTLALMWPRR